jgi:transcriptional regulator with XRE-family HTH domain
MTLTQIGYEMEIGGKTFLRAARETLGIDAVALAAMAGISALALHRFEIGERDLDDNAVKKLSQLLGLPERVIQMRSKEDGALTTRQQAALARWTIADT